MTDYRRDVNLQAHNTLAVPARARYFAEADDIPSVRAALEFARAQALPLLILGGGSNIVLGDDFPGLVLQVGLLGRELIAEDDHYYYLRVAAGENWVQLVDYCLQRGYWGLENLSLIPGSVGAAPIQNIGAYGVELCELFWELEAVAVDSGEQVRFDRQACEFGYRDSVFKGRLRDRYLITSVTLKLHREPQLNLSYPALREALADQPAEQLTPAQVSRAVCAIRRSKLPDPAVVPNVGSFFKNPLVTVEQYQSLQEDWPDLVAFPVDDRRVKLAAAWLIDRAGWRGYREGPVAVHHSQALVLTNEGHGSGAMVLALAAKIADSIWQKYRVQLEFEPRVYP